MPALGGERQKAIVLLTDGQPSETFTDHMPKVNDFVRTHFPEPEYRIYVVGMIDASSPYWAPIEPYWESTTNDPCTVASCPDPKKDRSAQVTNNTEVGKRFQEILQDLTTVIDEEIELGERVVPPYLKSIEFTYFKDDLNDHLEITDEIGKVDTARDGVDIIGSSGPIEVLRIDNPVPGNWTIATDPPKMDVDITERKIFAQSQLDSPLGPQTQYLPVKIQYTMLDDLGKQLPTYTDEQYKLIVEATVSVDEQAWPIMLNGRLDNIYIGEFTPVSPGTHFINVNARSQDYEGNDVVVFDEQIGEFEVKPAQLILHDIPPTVSQFGSGEIEVELQDERGFPLEGAETIDISLIISGPGGDETIQFEPQKGGKYRAKFSPQAAGSHKARVVATIEDSAGATHTVADQEVGVIEVSPTVKVDLVLEEPEDQLQQTATGLLPTDLIEVSLAVKLQSPEGRTLDPGDIFLNDAASAVNISITDEEGTDLSDAFEMQLDSASDTYIASSDQLGIGKFDFKAKVTGNLNDGYLYGETAQNASIIRIRHPQHIPILIGLIAFAAVVAVGAGAAIAKRHRDTRHPCKGSVTIVDAFGSPFFQTSLDAFNRNQIKITGKKINPITHVRHLEFTCSSDQDHESGRVHIRVWMDKDQAPVVDRLVSRNSEVKLGQYNFWLLKDPDEEMQLRDRSSMVADEDLFSSDDYDYP